MSVYPRYNYNNETNVLIGYTVYYTLTVTIRDIDKNKQKIAKVIDDLLNN